MNQKNINIDALKNNIDNLSKTSLGLNIDSIYIEENGNINKIIWKESYLHELRSCAKVLVAMAIGIAINKKMKINNKNVSLNTKIYPVIQNKVIIKNKNNLSKIKKWTIKNLLTHTTGYEGQMMSEKDIINVDKGRLLDYVLNYNIPNEVGSNFAYNNADAFILSVFFQEAFKINLGKFINDNIFRNLGITDYIWKNYGEYCPGATGLYMKHADFHKIGKLLLDDGKYDGKQIVSKKWIREMCKLQLETPLLYKKERIFPKIGVGYYIFISRNGYIFRDGANGQYIIINKEKNILITIMSSEKDMKNVTEIFKNVI